MDQAYLFNNGTNYQSYKLLGSRPETDASGEAGFFFAVWAPHATQVSVVGDFNGWDPESDVMTPRGTTGIWQTFVPGAQEFQRYKYVLRTPSGETLLKADPYARHCETRPGTASILYDADHDYEWTDGAYLQNRKNATDAAPLNIYEVHLGSWRRYDDGNVYSYREIAPQLASYVKSMGYNAVEFMPLTEYPLDESWGYQVTGYFAATSRYGTPADLKYLIDTLHRDNIKVILDWVPGHFPRDEFALALFDGAPLYEHPDVKRGENRQWGTLNFNYNLAEVRSFLMSSAWFWLDEFHVDGLRYDAVSSMLYLNFGRDDAEPNEQGGFDNLEAIHFLKTLNPLLREHFPHAILAAEESSAYPLVTTPVEQGGLGFTHKWNMGWMNDTLQYMCADYYARSQFHDKMTFSMMYAFHERFILPFSHDEVVHGKKSLLGRMPGDYWRQFASLRACYMYQMSHPGGKLNFMGNEFSPFIEWRYYEELEWFLLQYPSHRAMHTFVSDLNQIYLTHPAFWEVDRSWAGFEWMEANDRSNSVFTYARFSEARRQTVVVALNMTPASYEIFRLKVPQPGQYRVLLNSDAQKYYGSGFEDVTDNVFTAQSSESRKSPGTNMIAEKNDEVGRCGGEQADEYHILLPLPPLAGLYLLRDNDVGEA